MFLTRNDIKSKKGCFRKYNKKIIRKGNTVRANRILTLITRNVKTRATEIWDDNHKTVSKDC